MKKRRTVITVILLCLAMCAGFTACTDSMDQETGTDEFIAAALPVSEGLPVSESEIIAFFNGIITSLQTPGTFSSENSPGIKTTETLSAGNLNVLAYDTASGEAVQDDALEALNKSATLIKDRILSGMDTSVPVVGFGENNSVAIRSVIYPYDSEEMTLTPSDVTKAECYVDGSNLNLYLELASNTETIEKIFGIRNKDVLLTNMNDSCADYAYITDYTVHYTADDENNVHSTVRLSLEVEQQDDGAYQCTGRITDFAIKIIADVTANLTCAGSFAEYGDIQLNFRLTDEKSYEFDWFGTADWEPAETQVSEE